MPELATGTLIADKYLVESVLGRGGMGMVVAARHEKLGHRVAIKVLLPNVLDALSRRRLMREAQALASLKSEHVARVLDAGELDSDEPFIVMELLEGQDLAAVLAREGPLSLQAAASYLVQACDAISEAHAIGIVHRDLKPSNLFLTHRRDGSPLVKLLDFGVSKPIHSSSDESLTTTHSGIGTPEFMSPEQFTSAREVDTRTDIWSLGVVLYHLLTGSKIFGQHRAPALEIGMGTEKAPRLRNKLPSAPVEVEEIIVACLESKPEARIQTVAEFVARLLPFTDALTQQRYAHLVALSPTGPSSIRATSAVTEQHIPDAHPTVRDGRRVGWPSVVLAALATVAIIAAGLFAWRSRSSTSQQSAAPSAEVPPPTTVAITPVTPVASEPSSTQIGPVLTTSAPIHTRPASGAKPPASKSSTQTKSSEPRDPYGQRR
jgi:serine/threonine-protein kinase